MSDINIQFTRSYLKMCIKAPCEALFLFSQYEESNGYLGYFHLNGFCRACMRSVCGLWVYRRLQCMYVYKCPVESEQHHVGFPCMILGHFSGCMQQLLCKTRPAGHWQPGTQGLKQWLSITPSGTSTLKQVTGQGGPHSSNTKPRSTGQPTAVEDRHETLRTTEPSRV